MLFRYALESQQPEAVILVKNAEFRKLRIQSHVLSYKSKL